MQVWNLCASSAQIMRAASRSLFKREPSPRGSRLRACQKDFFDKPSIRMDGFVPCEALDQQQICTGILRRRCRLRATAHFLLALPKAAMQCIAAIWRWQNACGRTRWVRSDIRITKKETLRMDGFFFGDPYGNRTHVTAVKGRCLNRLTNGPGSGNLTRTDDTPGMNRMLYQLSYAAI